MTTTQLDADGARSQRGRRLLAMVAPFLSILAVMAIFFAIDPSRSNDLFTFQAVSVSHRRRRPRGPRHDVDHRERGNRSFGGIVDRAFERRVCRDVGSGVLGTDRRRGHRHDRSVGRTLQRFADHVAALATVHRHPRHPRVLSWCREMARGPSRRQPGQHRWYQRVGEPDPQGRVGVDDFRACGVASLVACRGDDVRAEIVDSRALRDRHWFKRADSATVRHRRRAYEGDDLRRRGCARGARGIDANSVV